MASFECCFSVRKGIPTSTGFLKMSLASNRVPSFVSVGGGGTCVHGALFSHLDGEGRCNLEGKRSALRAERGGKAEICLHSSVFGFRKFEEVCV